MIGACMTTKTKGPGRPKARKKFPPRILVIDDNEELARRLGTLLETRYDVTVAVSGFSALQLLLRQRFDVVILDFLMPGMDGPGFLRELDRLGKAVPVIVFSAVLGLEKHVRDLPVADFIAKPFDVEDLEAKIDRVVRSGGSRAPRKSTRRRPTPS
jgi:DNA-binding response OmpR family regulator